MPRKKVVKSKKVVKKAPKKVVPEKVVKTPEIKKVVKVVKEPVPAGPYDKYGVVLVREGPLSGEYWFKAKGIANSFGWSVAAGSLEEAYRTADATPAGLRR